ncbi:MAG: sulfite exporter TauE/SafE family protein [Candidatus Methanoperedens sp.]|nr:sulfite exporter TauE/SafE family protein [Candidatus Methanoperedens sp.]MCZ7404211.1 sulfite exporter TauE/SafE family protein [Candidatus Methanoperedens sp.]
MKYLPIILVLSFFLAIGCLAPLSNKEVSPSQLLSNPATYEGKEVCINGILNDNAISGIPVGKNQVISSDEANGTLALVCGIFKNGSLEPISINNTLTIFTEKDVYQSNETLKIRVFFNSPDAGDGKIQVSGIKNAFGRALISETRDAAFIKGANFFNFNFTTPSCEACSALSPGVYAVNATINIGGNTFETFRNITLERENLTVQVEQTEVPKANNSLIEPSPVNTSLSTTLSGNAVRVEYFYIPGCSKCEKATPVIEAVIKTYGGRVNFTEYNANEEGRGLAIQYGIPGTPSVIINRDKEKLISYENYNGDTAKLETLLRDSIDRANTAPQAANISSGKAIQLSVPSVLVVGFLAGFNPCLLAILAFIASVTLATTGRRRNVLLIVIVFSLGIFTTYLIVGIGILRVFEQSPSLQVTIRNFLAVLIAFLGLWHVYDAYHLRKNTESSFYTPKAFIRLTESITKKVSLPASFFMGALFSLIKAPCVGAVYFVILDMVRSGKGAGYVYLAAYNLGVVLPVLVLGAAIAFGLNPEKVEKFRKEKRAAMRLVTGVTLLAVAVLMYAGII